GIEAQALDLSTVCLPLFPHHTHLWQSIEAQGSGVKADGHRRAIGRNRCGVGRTWQVYYLLVRQRSKSPAPDGPVIAGTEDLYPLASHRRSMDSDFRRTGRMALQDPQGHTAVRIPHPQSAVMARRDQQRGIAFADSEVRVGRGVARDKAHTISKIVMTVED